MADPSSTHPKFLLASEPAARDVVFAVRDAIVETTGPTLKGLYVYGLAVAGDFDSSISDLDLIAVLAADPDEELARNLTTIHEALAAQHVDWTDRVEVVYVAADRLQAYQEFIPRMAVNSPGEPLNVQSGDASWVLTWYPARQEGVALVGPPITKFIPHIRRREFLDQVGARLNSFRSQLDDNDTRGACAYAILTVCRGVFTLLSGRRPSKLEASTWAAAQFPRWASLIESALAWRRDQWGPPIKDAAAVREARRFVDDMLDRLASG